MAEKKEYKPGIRKIKDFFSNLKVKPNSPKARLQRQKEQKLRAKGIGTSGDTDTEFKGSVKNLTSKGMARKMEDAKPTTTAGQAAGKAAGKSAPSSAGKAAGKAAAKKATTGQRAVAGLSAFQKAFAQARKEGKKDFKFNDRMYAAVTKQEVQRSGSSNLSEYLNKLKRKNTTIAKAPGQKKKGGIIKRAMGGSVNEQELQQISDRAALTEAARKAIEKLDRKKTEEKLRPARQNPLRPGRKMSKDERRQKFGFPRRPRPTDTGALGGGRQVTRPAPAAGIGSAMGAAVSEREMQQLMNMTPDRMKKGGSVMARGCKMGRKKPTKLY